MLHQKKLLKFYQDEYNSAINSIKQHAQILFDAASEMEKLDLPKINPNELRDGQFIQRVLNFYKEEWETNTAFKRVSFEKYLEFISLDYSRVEELERKFNSQKLSSWSFYKSNNKFYSYWQHSSRKGNMSFPSTISHPIEELYKIEGGKIIVDLNEEHFKIYSTSKKQLEVIDYIDGLVKAARGLDMDGVKIKHLLGNIMRDVQSDLSGYEINYCELMHKYR